MEGSEKVDVDCGVAGGSGMLGRGLSCGKLCWSRNESWSCDDQSLDSARMVIEVYDLAAQSNRSSTGFDTKVDSFVVGSSGLVGPQGS